MDEFELLLTKTELSLRVVNSELIYELITRFGFQEEDIVAAVKSVSVEELHDFITTNPALSHNNNMIIVYLLLIGRQMGHIHGRKTYDC